MPEGGFLGYKEYEKCAWPSRETNVRRQYKSRYVFAVLLTPFRCFFQQRFSQVVGRGKSEFLADVYAHRTDVVGRFVENGGNLQDGLAADNQAAHFSLRWCQRRQRCRNVGVLHPAVGHSLLHGPYQVGLSALVEMVEEVGDVFIRHPSASQLYVGQQFGFCHVESGQQSVEGVVIVFILALRVSNAPPNQFAQHACENLRDNEYHRDLLVHPSVSVEVSKNDGGDTDGGNDCRDVPERGHDEIDDEGKRDDLVEHDGLVEARWLRHRHVYDAGAVGQLGQYAKRGHGRF